MKYKENNRIWYKIFDTTQQQKLFFLIFERIYEKNIYE